MIKDFVKMVKENRQVQQYITYGIIILMTIIAIYTFSSSYFYSQKLKDTTLVVERQVKQYQITAYQGPSPFKVDMVDMSSEEKLKDIFISQDCPKYQKNAIGLIVSMYKIENVKPSTGEKYFTYEGAYDQLCTNKAIPSKK